ncbi:TetR/AcrR family transcriptional regulator [Streptomyces variegatus]|uniref:TetR/AcrR family transcriptional regulator n=1 Tax=Streptomyces variegatus TaxID=284040 RepID=UPI003C2D0F26
MGRPAGTTKRRMIGSAVELLRERGAAAVTIDAVLARSGAPRGSVYHHFPGGRNELLLTAAQQAGDYIARLIDAAVQDGDPALALDRFVGIWKQTLVDTDYLAGCPIVAVAVDPREDLPEATLLAREIFLQWKSRLRDLLTANGFSDERARRLATLTVAAVEGAVILCRTDRSAAPLDDVVSEIGILLTAERRAAGAAAG